MPWGNLTTPFPFGALLLGYQEEGPNIKDDDEKEE
jgi:hypothetical protein